MYYKSKLWDESKMSVLGRILSTLSERIKMTSPARSNSEYSVRNQVQAVNQQVIVVQGVKNVLYKACSVYCTIVRGYIVQS